MTVVHLGFWITVQVMGVSYFGAVHSHSNAGHVGFKIQMR